MKIEIDVDDSFLTKEKLAELKNYFVKKLIGIKAEIAETTLPDVFARLVFIAITKKLGEKRKNLS